MRGETKAIFAEYIVSSSRPFAISTGWCRAPFRPRRKRTSICPNRRRSCARQRVEVPHQSRLDAGLVLGATCRKTRGLVRAAIRLIAPLTQPAHRPSACLWCHNCSSGPPASNRLLSTTHPQLSVRSKPSNVSVRSSLPTFSSSPSARNKSRTHPWAPTMRRAMP